MDKVSGTVKKEIQPASRPSQTVQGCQRVLLFFKIYYKTIVYLTGAFSEDLILYICSTTCYLLAMIVKYIF